MLLVFSFLLVPVASFAYVDLQEVKGYIPDALTEDSFTVYCSEDSETFEFTWPRYTDFWVRVLGQTGKLLGDFQLSEGEQIELTGGGRFTLVIYSQEGSGQWTAKPVYFEEEEEYDEEY
jgi:hypothetical protein